MTGYIIKNKVVKGNGLGKKELGFATAKVDFFSDTKIVEGCYSSKIAIDGELYLGITNISFNNYYISETHILNFNQDIYGKEVPHLLDSYFECNTNIKIDFEKSYEGSYRGYRWRPSSIKEELK